MLPWKFNLLKYSAKLKYILTHYFFVCSRPEVILHLWFKKNRHFPIYITNYCAWHSALLMKKNMQYSINLKCEINIFLGNKSYFLHSIEHHNVTIPQIAFFKIFLELHYANILGRIMYIWILKETEFCINIRLHMIRP